MIFVTMTCTSEGDEGFHFTATDRDAPVADLVVRPWAFEGKRIPRTGSRYVLTFEADKRGPTVGIVKYSEILAHPTHSLSAADYLLSVSD